MIKTYFLDRDMLDERLNIKLMIGDELAAPAREAWDAGAYVRMADFANFSTEDDLDAVWHASNNGNGDTDSWSLAPMYPDHMKVFAIYPSRNGQTYGHRSMSVGDVLQLENGDRFVVAGMGFDKL